MASEPKDKLPPAGGMRALFVSPETYETIRRLLGSPLLEPDPTFYDIVSTSGRRQFRPRPQPPETTRPGGGAGGGDSGCALGSITTWTEGGDTVTGIAGGVVYAGDKNFAVPAKEISLGSDGEWLVYLEVDVEVNRDDDHEILLPGIKTSSESSPASFWHTTSGSSYPDNDPPSVSSGLGTIIIPIGELVVEDGVARLAPAGCGSVTIDQCGGTLTHTRG